MADKKKKTPASLGCLFWIAFILLVLVLFFFKRDNINTVLEKTKAMEFFGHKKEVVEPEASSPVIPKITTADGETPAEKPAADKEAKQEPSADAEPATPVKPTAAKPAVKPAAKPAAEKTATPAAEKPEASKPAASGTTTAKSESVKPANLRKATLFFVSIDADGRVLRKEVVREIPQTDSPLSDTLAALFKGATTAESGKGLRSLIPQGTRLLSATVKDGVATINLSEEFQFNQYGIEGYLGQLSQVVFTATTFPTVTSVQFLIEGQRREYLGAEGVWIGTPLSREKF